MSAILERWEYRLGNWALWAVSGSAHSVGVRSYDRLWWESPPRQAQPLIGDASDVDHLLHRLNLQDRAGALQYEAVRIRYLWTGSDELKSAQSQIPARTVRDRVFLAKYRLDELEQITRCVRAFSGVQDARLPAVSAACGWYP